MQNIIQYINQYRNNNYKLRIMFYLEELSTNLREQAKFNFYHTLIGLQRSQIINMLYLVLLTVYLSVVIIFQILFHS